MENATPMLQQYQRIKSNYANCILFFRLGDFYEMFSEDAKIASRILDVVLTSRDAGKMGRVPMCGIPYHAADNYIAKLIKAGHKVAICEQVEDPALAKGLVRRDVIRVITAGTYIDNSTDESHYLLSIVSQKKNIGVAFTDITSGVIYVSNFNEPEHIIGLIAQLPITECIFPAQDEDSIKKLFTNPLLVIKRSTLTPYDEWCFNIDIAQKALCSHFHIHNLKGFGIDMLPLAIASAGGLLEYCKQMCRQPLQHIDRISLYDTSEYVFISPAACYGLELEQLFKTINHTITSLGKRKLRQWLYHPLKNPAAIHQRQNAITFLKNNPPLQQALVRVFRTIPDIEKSISRLSSGYTSARDLLALRTTLIAIPDIRQALMPYQEQMPLFALDDITPLRQLLSDSINPDIPLAQAEGKIIRAGYNKELDELRQIQENRRQWLKDLQSREIQRTKINSLKIGFNKIFGYYIEISNANLHLVPSDYIRKQTLVNAERFITPELKEFEEKMLSAEETVLRIETQIIKIIQQTILDNSALLHKASEQLAIIDVLYSLSVLAQNPDYILPEVHDGDTITIQEGKHPVVLTTTSGAFVPNNTLLDCTGNHLLIITGPNMAGKSTYIRQVALLVILSQTGSFIPARSASIGIVDKIFTRIGAHDDINRGQSTFMVEMSETADILNNLSPRSLIILDEIGRGTSTFDGLSLAWAIAEHLISKKVRTLFATHFHELTALDKESFGVKNYNIAVKEWNDEIVFLHKIVLGGTDDSYGIYVAQLAGIPKDVLLRARQILLTLERKSNIKEKICNSTGLPGNFLALEDVPIEEKSCTDEQMVMEKIQNELQSLNINELTPLKALNKLQEWKHILEDKAKGAKEISSEMII